MRSFFITSCLMINVFIVNAQDRYNFYTDEIRKVAPNIPVQPEGQLKDLSNYRASMVLWAQSFPKEYESVKLINRRVTLFEPLRESKNPDAIPLSRRPDHNPSYMRYPVGKDKPVFKAVLNEDNDSTVYRNKLKHWYYLYNKEGYKEKYGALPEIKDFPKPIYHPDELGDELLPEHRAYYSEFYVKDDNE